MIFKKPKLPSEPVETVTQIRFLDYESAARIKHVTSVAPFAGKIAMEVLPTHTPAGIITTAERILATQAFQNRNLYNSLPVLAEQVRSQTETDHVAVALTGHPDTLVHAEIAASDLSDEVMTYQG